MQDVLVQTYSGKVVAFSEEEVGSYQPSSAPASPLKRLTTQFSKVHESPPPATTLHATHLIATLFSTIHCYFNQYTVLTYLITVLKMSIVLAAYIGTASFVAQPLGLWLLMLTWSLAFSCSPE